MRKHGYSEYTIRFVSKALSLLDKRADLNDPESVKVFLRNMILLKVTREIFVTHTEHYVRYYGLMWNRPKYWAREKLSKIPQEKKIDMIISSSYRSLALKLKISKEKD